MNLCIGEEGGWGIPGDLNKFIFIFILEICVVSKVVLTIISCKVRR